MDLSRHLTMYLVLVVLAVTHGFKLSFPSHAKRAQFDKSGKLKEKDEKLFFKSPLPLPVTEVKLGQSLTINCEAGGSPEPTLHWLFNGERIPQGSNSLSDEEAIYETTGNNNQMQTLRMGSTKARLYIDCVTPANLGEYTCVADTPYSRISRTTVLKVEDTRDEFTDSSCIMKRLNTAGDPARIVMWTAQRLEFEGADVQLFCRRDGTPVPKISWYDREDNLIEPLGNTYKILANGDLVIKDISWENHMGVYKCVAENKNGEDEVTTFLYPTTPE